jgi:hypothetical protein
MRRLSTDRANGHPLEVFIHVVIDAMLANSQLPNLFVPRIDASADVHDITETLAVKVFPANRRAAGSPRRAGRLLPLPTWQQRRANKRYFRAAPQRREAVE